MSASRIVFMATRDSRRWPDKSRAASAAIDANSLRAVRFLQAQHEVVALDRGPRFVESHAQQAAHPIAIDRERQRLAADDDARAADVTRRGHRDQLQELALAAASAAKQRLERARAREPVAATSPEHRRGTSVDQGASRTRPFARRAESTLRPPTLFIRARKPCVRLRLTTEGWNVRFMMVGLGVKKPYIRTC
jgi:hypothetical protein